MRKIILRFIFTLLLFSVSNSVNSATKNQASEHDLNLIPRQPADKSVKLTLSLESSIAHVVVKFRDDYEVRKYSNKLFSKNRKSISEASIILSPYLDFRMNNLFSSFSEKELDNERTKLQYSSRMELADLNSYYQIEVTSISEAQQLIDRLNRLISVEIAYAQPTPEPAVDISPPTPDYTASQTYLYAAPAGVDAIYANLQPGGDGTGVKIIDIEGAWRDSHEDLEKAAGQLIGGPMLDGIGWRNHGSAVLGELIGGDNGYGVRGICPGADIGMISFATLSVAEAIYTGVDNLSRGDLILIELQAPGPHFNFQVRADQKGYVCMEYWPANYDAMLYAWAKGIVVVEAAGNGAEDFDDFAIYGSLFDTTYRNSHALIVGAGYQSGHASDLERISYSNYGERVNLQGYASGVYTAGYGLLFNGGNDEDQYYTATFGGTSAAAPIVTGSAACLQGFYKNLYSSPLTSDNIRDILVANGTGQLGNTDEHIGPRPDLQASFNNLYAPASLYASPFVIDTSISEFESAEIEVWLHNRSNISSLDFSIDPVDSLARTLSSDWLSVSPTSGTIGTADSLSLLVTLDASIALEQIEAYKKIIRINWGESGGALDSLSLVPVYLAVPCASETFAVTSSEKSVELDYNWISARDKGFFLPWNTYNNIVANPLDDGTAGPITLGFDFNYYDTSYSSVYIGVNGAISFADENVNANGYFDNFSFPGVPLNNFISAFWNDLIFDTAFVDESGIYIFKNKDTIVIEWYHPANFNQFGDTTANFEIILTADRNILFQYKDLGSSGLENITVIGISAMGCDYLGYYNNDDIPENKVVTNEALSFGDLTGSMIQAGDVNSTDEINIADLTYLVAYFFKDGGAPVPPESGNVNCTAEVDIADLTYFVKYFFKAGKAPCYFWKSF